MRRTKVCDEHAAEVARMQAEAAENRKRKPGSVRQTIDEQKPDENRTDAQRAKTAGTNRQYINDAER